MSTALKNFYSIPEITAKEIAKKLNKIGKNIPEDTAYIFVVSPKNELLCIFGSKDPSIDFYQPYGFDESDNFEGISYNLECVTEKEIASFCSPDLWDLLINMHKAIYLNDKYIDLETRYL